MAKKRKNPRRGSPQPGENWSSSRVFGEIERLRDDSPPSAEVTREDPPPTEAELWLSGASRTAQPASSEEALQPGGSAREQQRHEAASPAAARPAPPADAGGNSAVPTDWRCSVCGEAMAPSLTVLCARCKTPHHRDCFEYAGQCAVFACGAQRFEPFRAPAPSSILRLADQILPPSRGSRAVVRPSARATPSSPAGPALPTQGNWPASLSGNRGVVADILSPAEWGWRALALVGLLSLGLAVMTGPHPHSIDPTDPWTTLSAAAFLIGFLLSVGLEDQLLFEPDDRTVYRVRDLFGHRSMRPVHAFADFREVAVVKSRFWLTSIESADEAYDVYWIVLVRQDGSEWILGNPAGSPEKHGSDDVQRAARRIATSMGLALENRAGSSPALDLNHRLGWFTRVALWMVMVALGGAWLWDAIRTPLGLEGLIALAIPAFVLQVFLYWWIVERARGTFLPSRQSGRQGAGRGTGEINFKGAMGALLFFLASLGATPYFSHELCYNLRAQLYFRQATCKILEQRFWAIGRKNPSYRAEFKFSYEVNGRPFTRTGYAVSDFDFYFEASAKHALDAFPKDTVRQCWYDPAQPAYAVLDRNLDGRMFTLLGLALLTLKFSASTVLRQLRRERQ